MQSSILIIYLSLVLISLSYKKYYKKINKNELNPRISSLILILGSILLIFSVYVCINNLGSSIGLAIWFFALTPLIIFISLVLTYAGKLLIPLSFLFILINFI